MRGTWQLVVPHDLSWLLDLLGPGLRAQSQRRHRQLGLDEKSFTRAESVLTKLLSKGAAATRETLRDTLEAAGLSTEGQRLSHLLVELELRGLLCSGPLADGAATSCLVEHRVRSVTKKKTLDEALAELARSSTGARQTHQRRWWAPGALPGRRRPGRRRVAT